MGPAPSGKATSWWFGEGQRLEAVPRQITKSTEDEDEPNRATSASDCDSSAGSMPVPADALPTRSALQSNQFPFLDLQTAQVSLKDVCETFCVPKRLTYVKGLGFGAYGIVAHFVDKASGKDMAVKKIGDCFRDLHDGKRILREMRLLRSFDHENIIKLVDAYTQDKPDFDDIYIITEKMDSDLATVIRFSKLAFTEDHQRWMTYQILRGVMHLHTAGVMHRDLKPANILVNKDCSVKICDLGLARGAVVSELAHVEDTSGLTEYVVTRWYRAPEVALLGRDYGAPIDIWAVGCILCELVGRSPLFQGRDTFDQIRQIFDILGGPSADDLHFVSSSPSAFRFISKFIGIERVEWAEMYPEASSQLVDSIEAMVRFNPMERLSALECMRLSFFEPVYEDTDEAARAKVLSWDFDKFKPTRAELRRRPTRGQGEVGSGRVFDVPGGGGEGHRLGG